MLDHLSVSGVATGPGVSCSAANDAILAEGRRRLIDDPARFEGVTTIGVDKYRRRHTRNGNKYLTAIIDLTPVRETICLALLLDMVEGRSKTVFEDWLAARPKP